ncbi:MAG: hypothetical protein GWP10_20205 [Nitrospiraceae bacterium]|nr:hypothetical protein [Nitrospiraceae bacterium]
MSIPYENKLIYYKQNWKKLVNKAIKEQIDGEMNREREENSRLKAFIEQNYGKRKIVEILSGGQNRDTDMGPGI